MVIPDRHNHRHFWRHDIRTIKLTPQPHFQHHNITPHLRIVHQRHCSLDLKQRNIYPELRLIFINYRLQFHEQLLNLCIRNLPTIHLYPLIKSHQMRRHKLSGFVPRFFQNLRHHLDHATLAIRPRYVHKLRLFLRMPQPRHQKLHRLKRRILTRTQTTRPQPVQIPLRHHLSFPNLKIFPLDPH